LPENLWRNMVAAYCYRKQHPTGELKRGTTTSQCTLQRNRAESCAETMVFVTLVGAGPIAILIALVLFDASEHRFEHAAAVAHACGMGMIGITAVSLAAACGCVLRFNAMTGNNHLKFACCRVAASKRCAAMQASTRSFEVCERHKDIFLWPEQTAGCLI